MNNKYVGSSFYPSTSAMSPPPPPPPPPIVSLCMLFCFLFCVWLKIHHFEQCPTPPNDNHLQIQTNVLLSQFVNIPFCGSWHFVSLQFLAALPRALPTLCARLVTGCLVTWWPTAVYLATASATRALVNAPVTAVVPGSKKTPTLFVWKVRRRSKRERRKYTVTLERSKKKKKIFFNGEGWINKEEEKEKKKKRKKKKKRVFGDVVTYSCLPGYSLSNSGTGQRTCDSSGAWVADDTDPYCATGEKESKKRERGGRGEGGAGWGGWSEDRVEKRKEKKNEHERKDTTAPPPPNKNIK